MQHPLENPSLTPLGFGSGDTPQRTKCSDWAGNLNGDWFAAKFWETANRLQVAGPRPAEVIIHEIMPSMKAIGRTDSGDFVFAGKLYQTNDLAIITTFARWLGTNWGSDFLDHTPYNMPTVHSSKEFLVKLDLETEKNRSMTEHFKHTCSKELCGNGQCCYRVYVATTEREELAVRAFAFWLATSAGRVYIAALKAERTLTSAAVRDAYRREHGRYPYAKAG